MKNGINYLIIIGLTVALYNCNSNQNNQNNQNPERKNSTAVDRSDGHEKEYTQNQSAFGPIHWGINDDAFGRLLTEWTTQHQKNGITFLGNMKIGTNGFIPKYNGKGHLNELTIHLSKFSIHPASDYSEKEKSRIYELYLKHNQKMDEFIQFLSTMYGEAIEIDFEKNKDDFYFSDSGKAISKWETKTTKVSLHIQNKTFAGMTGCELSMWLEIKELN